MIVDFFHCFSSSSDERAKDFALGRMNQMKN